MPLRPTQKSVVSPSTDETEKLHNSKPKVVANQSGTLKHEMAEQAVPALRVRKQIVSDSQPSMFQHTKGSELEVEGQGSSSSLQKNKIV